MQQLDHVGLSIRRKIAVASLSESVNVLRYDGAANRCELLHKMSLDHLTVGLHAWLVEHDPIRLKQHFYLSSMLNLSSLEQAHLSSVKLKARFTPALFSDNAEIIQRYAALVGRPLYKGKPQADVLPHQANLLQLLLRDEPHELDRQLVLAGEHCVELEKGSGHEMLPSPRFYVSLRGGDKAMLEALILLHARQRAAVISKRQRPPRSLIGHFLSASALMSKLCWIRGMPVHVEHDLVPMDLMPVTPLPQYLDTYDFLFRKPKRMQVVRKISGWLSHAVAQH
mgnify:CR=1 FL=1